MWLAARKGGCSGEVGLQKSGHSMPRSNTFKLTQGGKRQLKILYPERAYSKNEEEILSWERIIKNIKTQETEWKCTKRAEWLMDIDGKNIKINPLLSPHANGLSEAWWKPQAWSQLSLLPYLRSQKNTSSLPSSSSQGRSGQSKDKVQWPHEQPAGNTGTHGKAEGTYSDRGTENSKNCTSHVEITPST